jgi:GNAT superfamily N-acetyltransferase
LDRVASATADDCARFQTEALKRPVNWRKDLRTPGQAADELQSTPRSPKKPRPSKTQQRRALNGVPQLAAETISSNTVLKWSRMLQAAFQRANRNAGKKCVRGVVAEDKLLTANPWTQFTWVEGTDTPIRQFDAGELVSILDFLEKGWKGVPVAVLAVKVLLWSCCRKLEVAGLIWGAGRVFTNDRRVVCASDCSLTAEGVLAAEGRPVAAAEVHFEVVGKWGVERWFRIPGPLFRELLVHRTDSPFVFAAYTEQIRRLHADNPGCLKKVRDEFTPKNFGRWLYERIKDWAATHGGDAYLHVFRKTGLQFAHDGEEEEASRKVAADAGVSEKVLLGHYVKPKLWRQSNRTFRRLLASLPPEVASRYGYVEDERTRLEREREMATEADNWALVAELAAVIGRMDRASRSEAS